MNSHDVTLNPEDSDLSGLRKIKLESEYNTDDDNIVRDFYHPCLKESTKYDRAVGYFRANIYRELGEDLLNFVIRGGKVRIVTSPDIPEPDESAAREGYGLRGKRSNEEQEASLIKVMETMSKNPKESDCLDMLRLLIEKGSLDLFIAIRKGGIYHRKIGIFCDSFDNKVVFSGSGNETSRAVCPLEDWGNDEDFDVFRSWGDEFEARKARRKEIHLKTLFAGRSRRTKVRPLNEVEREYLKRFRAHTSFEDCREGARQRSRSWETLETSQKSISLYTYQREAIKAWEAAGNIGMLSMATATGKTYTALFAVEDLLIRGNPILILVPSKILIDHWSKSISEVHPNVPVLLAGGGHSWKAEPNKRLFISNIRRPRIILATMDTAVSDDFIEFFKQARNPVLIADEAHRLGSKVRRRILDLDFKARLGLSATPERLFDREGSEILADVFGETPVYCLDIGASVKLSDDNQQEVPILGHFLSRYEYDFYPVKLTAGEQERWGSLTSRIKKLVAISLSKEKEEDIESNSRLSQLLIERARIIKKAENKIKIVNRIIEEKYPSDGRWIVYCEDENQLDLVANTITSNFRHLVVLKYHSKMTLENRDRALEYFEHNPSIIVSIRCLDEGVDVPSADGAIILASSSNPRQYIQRRGRVLRTARGKKYATIIDVLVLPDSEESEVPFSIVRGELARAWNFARNAQNRDMTHRLWRKCMEYGVNLEQDARLGLEEEKMED